MVCVLRCAKRTSLFDVCVVGPVGPQFMFPVDEICVSNRFVCNLALSDMLPLSGCGACTSVGVLIMHISVSVSPLPCDGGFRMPKGS